jgi:hypothetical protein
MRENKDTGARFGWTRFGFAASALSLIVGVGVAAAGASNALADGKVGPAASIGDALMEGDLYADVRYRYEFVAQDGFNDDAFASTVRGRVGYQTGIYEGFGMLVEADLIQVLGDDDYNNTRNDKTGRPVIADPAGSELNQLFITYQGAPNILPDTLLKVGRQRIKLDNVRHIGNVGWRQNEQTYDAALIRNESLPDTSLTYAFISNVNRITGEESRRGDDEMASHIMNARYSGLPFGTISAYSYLLDYESDSLTGLSTQTYGARFAGSMPVTDVVSVLYQAEYAYQADFQDNPRDYDVHYVMGSLGAKAYDVTVKANYEQLGGDGTSAFQTSLATLHAFQGETDKFLTTPAGGIEDLYQTVGTTLYGVKLLGMHHNFWSEETGTSYGEEWSMRATYTFDTGGLTDDWVRKLTVGGQGAHFNSDGFSTDTDKVWFWISTKL